MKAIKADQINIFCVLIGIMTLALDQCVKWAALAYLPGGDVVTVCPYFNFVLVFNRGTSFGLLEPSTLTQHYLIVGIQILCISFLTYLFIKFKTITEKILGCLIISGALGNLMDRFIHGAVVDFLDVHYKSIHWPAFNVADAVISCGAVCLLLFNIFSRRVS
jgi:signal peptidase II